MPISNPASAELQIKVIPKIADQTVNNSIVMVNDTHLLFAVGANEVWVCEAFIIFITEAAADIDIAWTVPALAEIRKFDADDIGPLTGNIALNWHDAKGVINLNVGARVNYVYWAKLLYIGGANAGNVQLQWAQSVADVSDTIVLENSYLRAVKIR